MIVFSMRKIISCTIWTRSPAVTDGDMVTIDSL